MPGYKMFGHVQFTCLAWHCRCLGLFMCLLTPFNVKHVTLNSFFFLGFNFEFIEKDYFPNFVYITINNFSLYQLTIF